MRGWWSGARWMKSGGRAIGGSAGGGRERGEGERGREIDVSRQV